MICMGSAERRFFTICEVVRITGLSEVFLRCGVKSGRVPHIMSGNRALINLPLLLEQLDAASRSNLTTAKEAGPCA